MRALEDAGEEAVVAPTFMPRLSVAAKRFHIERYRDLHAGRKKQMQDEEQVDQTLQKVHHGQPRQL
jgi:hypothetical protein